MPEAGTAAGRPPIATAITHTASCPRTYDAAAAAGRDGRLADGVHDLAEWGRSEARWSEASDGGVVVSRRLARTARAGIAGGHGRQTRVTTDEAPGLGGYGR
jgi:hypothetical protein